MTNLIYEKMTKLLYDMRKQSKEEFVDYDFKDEAVIPGTNEKAYKSEKPLEKYNEYKRADDFFDCDVCLKALTIYAKVFPYANVGEVQEQDSKWNKNGFKYQIGTGDRLHYTGDTLLSAQTTMNEYFKMHGENTVLPYEAIEFLRTVHTAGNFIPSPCGNNGSVNGPRGTGVARDYPDLYLLAIYNDLTNQELYGWTLERILGKNTADVCREMLSKFEGKDTGERWIKFINVNLLQDSIKILDDHRYGEPKELWKGHFCGNVLPKDEDDFLQFWRNGKEQIKCRSMRIKEIIDNVQDF